MTAQGWSAHLDELERSVARQRQELAALEPTEVLTVADVAPPAGIGPLPQSHRARAVDLLMQLELLQTELQRARDRTGRALSASRRARTAVPTAGPSYVDTYS